MSSNKKVLIHYIFHSGFAVEVGDYFFVFDYYDPSDRKADSRLNDAEIIRKITKCKYPFVFVSHGHHDHFSPTIFNWKDNNPHLTYIFSSDVKWEDNISKNNLGISFISMLPYEYVEKNDISISSYGSTDLGVSFLVEIDGLRIFHAGDLNWWHWADESTKEELEEEEWKFKNEVAKIREEKIDILFFPVDPRLGEHYWLGGAYMLELFQPSLFVPMHFGDNPEISRKFSERMSKSGVPIFEIASKGQIYELLII